MPKIGIADLDSVKRRLLTPQNLVELKLNGGTIFPLLADDTFKVRVRVGDKDVDVYPDGISINETSFGVWDGPSATARGFNSYMNIGAPLVEERADLIQPPADVLSARSYENRSSRTPRQFSDSLEFTISNTLNWSISGTSEFSGSGMIHSEVGEETSATLTESLAQMCSMTATMHDHKDNIGTQSDNTVSATVTNEASDTAGGHDTAFSEMSGSLMLGITGSLSGSVTTSWTSTSTVSGDIEPNSRLQTQATQRRQIRHYTYQLPIAFDGFVALHYPHPVPMQAKPPQQDNQHPAPGVPQDYDNVIAVPIQKLKLNSEGRPYTAKGVAETTSTLGVDHVIFDHEEIPNRGEQFSDRNPHNLDPVPNGI